DIRYTTNNNTIVTNDKISYNYLNVISISNLLDNISKIEEFDNIFIDEGQFFNDLTQAIKYLKLKNKNIYISYLNLDYQLKPFSNVDVLCHADNLIVLTSVCYKCKISISNYTQLIDENKIKDKANNIIIAGLETFK